MRNVKKVFFFFQRMNKHEKLKMIIFILAANKMCFRWIMWNTGIWLISSGEHWWNSNSISWTSRLTPVQRKRNLNRMQFTKWPLGVTKKLRRRIIFCFFITITTAVSCVSLNYLALLVKATLLCHQIQTTWHTF